MRAVEVARALGGNRVYLFTALDGADYPFQQDYRSARKYTVEALQEICERAGEVNMALECRSHTPKGWTNIGSIAASLDLITEIARPNLGVQLEIAHTILAGENLGQMAWGNRAAAGSCTTCTSTTPSPPSTWEPFSGAITSGSAWSFSTGCAR